MAWWQWITRPEVQAARRIRDRRISRRALDYKLKRKATDKEYEESLKKSHAKEPIKGQRLARFSEFIRWVEFTLGGEDSPQAAARKGKGAIGSINAALSQTLSTIRIIPSPDFNRTLQRYVDRSQKSIAEALLLRVSNILAIMNRELKTDAAFRHAILQAARKSSLMYRKKSTLIPSIRFGELLLHWSQHPKYEHHKMSKRILPKPTPAIQGATGLGKRRVWQHAKETGKSEYWSRIELATDRFIKMHANPKARLNKAIGWYRVMLDGCAQGIISTATSSSKVDINSVALMRAKRHWDTQEQINSPKEKLAGQGYFKGSFKGTRWNPKIELLMRGRLPFRIFPQLIQRAIAKDITDMRGYITRKMNR